MHLIWGMMNTLQLISYMILKFNLTIPSNVYLFFTFINDFLSMRAQFLDQWVDYVTEQIFKLQNGFSNSLSNGNEDSESGSNPMKALGTYLLAGIALLLCIVVALILVVLTKRFPVFMKLYNIVKRKLFYNSILRFGIQSYFKFCMVAMNALAIGLIFDEQTQLTNSIIVLGITAFTIFYPAFTYWFLKKHSSKLGDSDFNQSFGSLYLNIRTLDGTSSKESNKPIESKEIGNRSLEKVRTSTMLITIFLTRRLIFSTVIVFLSDYPFAQILFMQLFSVSLIGFLITVQPLNSRLLNFLELFNESILFITQLIVVGFTEFQSASIEEAQYRQSTQIHRRLLSSADYDQVDVASTTRENLGWLIIALTSLSIGVGMIGVVGGAGQVIFGKVKQIWQKKCNNNQSRVIDLKQRKYVDETYYADAERSQHQLKEIYESNDHWMPHQIDEQPRVPVPQTYINNMKKLIQYQEDPKYDTPKKTVNCAFFKDNAISDTSSNQHLPNSQHQNNKSETTLKNEGDINEKNNNEPYHPFDKLINDPVFSNQNVPWKSLLAKQLMADQSSEPSMAYSVFHKLNSQSSIPLKNNNYSKPFSQQLQEKPIQTSVQYQNSIVHGQSSYDAYPIGELEKYNALYNEYVQKKDRTKKVKKVIKKRKTSKKE